MLVVSTVFCFINAKFLLFLFQKRLFSINAVKQMNFKKYKNLGHKRMLDIKYIAENPDVIKDGLAKKGYSKDVIDVDALIALYKDINKLKTSSQSLSEEKNKLSNSIKSASAEERPAIIAKSKALGEELKVDLMILCCVCPICLARKARSVLMIPPMSSVARSASCRISISRRVTMLS